MVLMPLAPWLREVGEAGEGGEEEEEEGGTARPFWVCSENERWWPLPVWGGLWNFKEPLETEGMREAEWADRPVWGLRGLEVIDGLVAGGLGRLELSPLEEGRELLFPELGERAGILEAGKEGEVGLQSPTAFLALPLACKQRWRKTVYQKAGNTISPQGLATQPFWDSFNKRITKQFKAWAKSCAFLDSPPPPLTVHPSPTT